MALGVGVDKFRSIGGDISYKEGLHEDVMMFMPQNRCICVDLVVWFHRKTRRFQISNFFPNNPNFLLGDPRKFGDLEPCDFLLCLIRRHKLRTYFVVRWN